MPITQSRFTRRHAAWAFAGILRCPIPMYSQLRKRAVHGRVIDQRGMPIRGAVVFLTNTWSQNIRSYDVGKDGRYRFPGLQTEVDYELKAQIDGVTGGTRKLNRFDAREDASIDLKIELSFHNAHR